MTTKKELEDQLDGMVDLAEDHAQAIEILSTHDLEPIAFDFLVEIAKRYPSIFIEVSEELIEIENKKFEEQAKRIMEVVKNTPLPRIFGVIPGLPNSGQELPDMEDGSALDKFETPIKKNLH